MSKLAIDGGTPVRTQGWPGRTHLGEDDIEAVVRVLRSGLGALDRYSGSEVTTFEEEMARFYGTKFGVGCTSGTASVHIALGAGDFDVGSEVITSPVTDPGAVSPILMQNLVPIFADVDFETLTLNPESVEERITDRTRAIIVTHLSGVPADMDRIMEIAKPRGIMVIEDCAQAHGATYKGRLVGSIGDIGAFSLMHGKHTTTAGQGGIVLTSNEDLYYNALRFADRGKPFGLTGISGNVQLGINYRMTGIQAAMGRTQLKKLAFIASRRYELVEMVKEGLKECAAVKVQESYVDTRPSYWVLPLRVDTSKLKVDGVTFGKALQAEGIPGSANYAGLILYNYPYFKERKTYGKSRCPWSCPYYGKDIDYSGSCPNAEKAVEELIRVSIHESCNETEVEDIITAVKKLEAAYLK